MVQGGGPLSPRDEGHVYNGRHRQLSQVVAHDGRRRIASGLRWGRGGERGALGLDLSWVLVAPIAVPTLP
jgi:hypothetical protein